MRHARRSIATVLLVAVAAAAAAQIFIHADCVDDLSSHALVRPQTSPRSSSSHVLAKYALTPELLHVHAHAATSVEHESTHATPVTNRQRLAQLTLLRI